LAQQAGLTLHDKYNAVDSKGNVLFTGYYDDYSYKAPNEQNVNVVERWGHKDTDQHVARLVKVSGDDRGPEYGTREFHDQQVAQLQKGGTPEEGTRVAARDSTGITEKGGGQVAGSQAAGVEDQDSQQARSQQQPGGEFAVAGEEQGEGQPASTGPQTPGGPPGPTVPWAQGLEQAASQEQEDSIPQQAFWSQPRQVQQQQEEEPENPVARDLLTKLWRQYSGPQG
jgi:hypothetical protein